VARSYWLDLFTGTIWEEFLAAGGEVSGFRERRWKTVQQMKPGDYLLCYLTASPAGSACSRWSPSPTATPPHLEGRGIPGPGPRPLGCHSVA
jgi:hypothetical protein